MLGERDGDEAPLRVFSERVQQQQPLILDALGTRVCGLVPRAGIMSAKSPLMLSLSIRQLGSVSD